MDDSAPAFDPAAYSRLIGQVQVQRIWLVHARVTNDHGATTPDSNSIGIQARSHWNLCPGGFQVFHSYLLTFEGDDKTRHAEIQVEFGVEYASKEPMTEAFFTVFREVNLPVNTWPYLREYVSTTLGRMGWSPITLPAFKILPGPDPSSSDAPPPTTTKRRRAKRSAT